MSKLIKITALWIFLLIPLVINAEVQTRIIGGQVSAEKNWPFMSALMFKKTGITVSTGETFNAFFMQGTPSRNESGILVNCDKAFTKCVGVDNKICLIERGTSLFTEKILNCARGGGLAAIIYNNVDGLFLGEASDASIPAFSLSRDDGLALLNQLNENISFGFLDSIPEFSFCGGSYIGDKWVVTAAHCIVDTTAASMVINIGGHNLETDQQNVIDVANIYIHRAYSSESLNNDIALIQLKSKPINITPIALADNSTLQMAIDSVADVVTIGRGTQTPVGSTITDIPIEIPGVRDPRLYDVVLSLIDNTTCNQTMGDLISPGMICAGNIAGGVGSCKGDSGGPLVYQQLGTDYLIGITSWGFGCAQAGFYGVYARPTYFKSSIEALINNKSQSNFIPLSLSPEALKGNFDGEINNSESNKDDNNFGSLNIIFLIFLFCLVFGTRKMINTNRK